MKIGNEDVSKLYLGSAEISKIMLGTSQVYDGGDTPTPPAPVPYDEQYLTVETLTDGYLEFETFSQGNIFYYSTNNGTTWNTIDQAPLLTANEKVLIKGVNPTATLSHGIGRIKYSGEFNVYGNVMSLVYGDNFVGQTAMNDYQFTSLFDSVWQESYLISAENLVLPATALTIGCYMSMFKGCASLTTAPVLSATTLAESCYNDMFSYCTSLNYIKCLATNISATECTRNWVGSVTSTGTFVKASLMQIDWQCGDSGIPEGWTVEDENGNPETNPCDDQE